MVVILTVQARGQQFCWSITPIFHCNLLSCCSPCFSLRLCVFQVSYLLRGLFARACKSLGTVSESSESIRGEVAQLRGLLAAKLAQINMNLEGEHTALLGCYLAL